MYYSKYEQKFLPNHIMGGLKLNLERDTQISEHPLLGKSIIITTDPRLPVKLDPLYTDDEIRRIIN